MNQAKLLFLLIATLAFASCRQTARQTVADAEQPTDSTEALTSADTLRMVIIDKSISRIDSVVQARIINPNDYDVSYGQEYAIERETRDRRPLAASSIPQGLRLHLRPEHRSRPRLRHRLWPYRPAPPHARPLPPDQTDRRPHPLRRLLHPQHHHLPHTCL